MQEEVNEKTISLCIKGGKITAQILKAALIKLLAEMDKKKQRGKGEKSQCKKTGRQSIKSLQKSGAQITNIVVTDNNIKSFDRVVNSSSGIIRGNTAIDISSLSMQMQAAMATMAIGELVTLALETLVVSWCLKILSVVITVIMYGRMIEIYLYTSLAPIPFATMSNREWGHVGTNYFRGLFALAFQAFLMMVCVAIYAALIGSIRVSSDIHSALFGTMAYTVILCFSLLKTGSLSKQIFGSH